MYRFTCLIPGFPGDVDQNYLIISLRLCMRLFLLCANLRLCVLSPSTHLLNAGPSVERRPPLRQTVRTRVDLFSSVSR